VNEMRGSIGRRIAQFIQRLPRWQSPGGFDEFEERDPHSGVRQPRGRNPNGRNSAVAVAEPDDDGTVVPAVGRDAQST